MFTPLLSIRNLSKNFGNLAALQSVDLRLDAGEVVGLAGGSGAGKSLLIRILAGLQVPDTGQMLFDHQYIRWPFQAQRIGIGVVHQEPELADQFDVTNNVFLGHEVNHTFWGRRLPIPNQRKMEEETLRLLASLNVRLPSLHAKVGNLSSEQRQLVALAQVMAQPAKLRIVDDPSLLSLPYQEILLEQIRAWQKQGIAVLFSSINLDHLFAVADRIAILREGHLVADLHTDETNREEIVAALVGTADRQQRTPVIWAIDSYYRARKQAETLRHNQTLLRRNLEAQDSVNRQLVDQLADQVRALDSANLALQDAQRRLLTEREEERKRLARELHDQMIQDLLSLNYQIEDIASMAEDSTGLADELAEVRESIRALVEDLRRICGNLRPPTIDSLGLGAALQSFTHDWSLRTGIEVVLGLDAEFGRLPEAIELSIFRIVQESLSNVWKHANATQVKVVLQHTSPRMLQMTIADDGEGLDSDFDLAKLSQVGHYGLLGLSERVALMGGRLNLRNQPNSGLEIQVEIPHPRVMPELE